jgi:hypothetical protein
MRDWSGGGVTSPDPTRSGRIATDLVEYLVLVVPGPEGLSSLAPELVRTAECSAVRILDLVVVSVGSNGEVDIVDTDSIPGLAGIQGSIGGSNGVLLSRHDLELVAFALRPGDCAVILVVEDRWAEPLAAAARAAGGEVRAGERIARDRVEASLAGDPGRTAQVGR